MRVNVESVPRLPTFPARWLVDDPRGRAYFVFWTTRDGNVAYALRMDAVEDGHAVTLRNDAGHSFRIGLVRRLLPTGGGTDILYQCAGCGRPRRYLYGHAVASGRLVDNVGWQCQSCAGLRWRSQGRYRGAPRRGLQDAIAEALGLPDYHEPQPRRPWDPRAVSNPGLVLDEFPNLLQASGPSI